MSDVITLILYIVMVFGPALIGTYVIHSSDGDNVKQGQETSTKGNTKRIVKT